MTTPDPSPQHAAPDTDETKPWISGRLYDTLKFLAQILLPGVATLYFALAGFWNLPQAEGVVGTITAVDAFLGGLLTVTKAQFLSTAAAYDGTVHVLNSAEGSTLSMNFDPTVLADNKTLNLKVVPPV